MIAFCEPSGLLERVACFRHEWRPDLEDVRNVVPDLQIDFDVRCASFIGKPFGIVQQDFCIVDLSIGEKSVKSPNSGDA